MRKDELFFQKRKQKAWKTKDWRAHGVACWDREWAEYKACAEAAGKSTNGWIRDWLNEGVKYDRLLQRDLLAERGGISDGLADERDPGFA